ncbi:DUF4389 domain-containing protein [Umboniibacter marinipuniceus]|uniref:Uncharacterized protein DUF4389 n=1 Tax=Umboniibacter marinipuniceus TaxID=569599 RepID=A0A3M0A947_9GAMM|nr:DUF4389 domain-containing protein [Umboniibacter marinipuniceus]RMA78935.1 uncharacterized protein DUF4389 [Umboniibacter marinipuniceus]
MKPESKYRFFEDAHWVRLLLMAIFWLVVPVIQFLIGVVAIVQALAALVRQEPIESLTPLGSQLARWVLQINDFLVYRSDRRPFPLSDWPDAE